jgi:hypothetical protein
MAEPGWAAQGHGIAFDQLVADAAAALQEGQLPAAEPTEAEIEYHNAVIMGEEDEFFEFIVGDTVDQNERAAVRAAANQRYAAKILSLGSVQLNTMLAKMRFDDRHKDHVDKYIQRLAEMWDDFARIDALLGRMATRHNPNSVVPSNPDAPVATEENTCEHCKLTMSNASTHPKKFKSHVATCAPKLILLDAAIFALMILSGTIRPGFNEFLHEFLGQRPVNDAFFTRWLSASRGGAASGQGAMRAHAAQCRSLTLKNATAPQIRDAMRAFVCKNPECIYDNATFFASRMREV